MTRPEKKSDKHKRQLTKLVPLGREKKQVWELELDKVPSAVTLSQIPSGECIYSSVAEEVVLNFSSLV